MITGETRNKIDRIWDSFWTGGITNPLTVIEQFTYLLFIKSLDDKQLNSEKEASILGIKPKVIFDKEKEDLRWSNFKHFDSEKMYKVIATQVFPFIKKLNGNADSSFARFMGDAIFTIPTPRMLETVVTNIDELMADLPLKDLGDLYEYMLSKLTTAGKNGQFRTPRHIIDMMVELVEPTPSDIVIDPAAGTGHFFGMLPDSMENSNLYGIELDGLTGRIAKQLYPNANISITGFEKTELPDSFFDLAIGNVPFGNYKLSEKKYDNLNFPIHDHFFAKTLDKVRPGGVVAFITSKGTMDKQSSDVRRYLAQRAELLGAIRLPNNAFKNAGTEVTSDIIFLQKRDRRIDVDRDWIHLNTNEDDIVLNSYFVDNPEMILGRMEMKSGPFGMESTCTPLSYADLSEQLKSAVLNIEGSIPEIDLPDIELSNDVSIPADPTVKNFSYTLVDGEVYYRENSHMVKPNTNETAKERIKGMVELRECVDNLIHYQLEDYSEETIKGEQETLNRLYDNFTAKYGLINSRGNSLAFSDDNSYYLLCSLEDIDENGNLKAKADMFTKRTIKKRMTVHSVDTASEALALSIAEKAKVDMEYMSKLTGLNEEDLANDLRGVIFPLPTLIDSDSPINYVTAD